MSCCLYRVVLEERLSVGVLASAVVIKTIFESTGHTLRCYLHSLMKKKSKFQLQVSENKVVIFFSNQVQEPLETVHGPLEGPCIPG